MFRGMPAVWKTWMALQPGWLTDLDGSYTLDGITPAAGIVLEFTKDGYAKNNVDSAREGDRMIV